MINKKIGGNDMKCNHAKKMLLDYVNGVINPEENIILQEHLANCQSCSKELRNMEKILDLVHDTKVEYPPEHVWDGFLDDLHQQIENEAVLAFKKQHQQRLYFVPGWVASIAAIIMIIIASTLITYHPSSNSVKVSASKNIETLMNSNIIKDDSEPNIIAKAISDVLITETEIAEIRKLDSFQLSESISYYDDDLDAMIVELGKAKDNKDSFNSLLNNEFSEFDNDQEIETYTDKYDSM